MSLQPRTVLGIPGVEKLRPEDLRAIVATADALGLDPDWLLAVEKFESNFNPAAVNKFSGATGAIQFMPLTAKNLGTTVEELKTMTLEQQQRFVYEYLSGFKKSLKSLEDTYLAVFYPAAIGKSDDLVIGTKDTGSAFQQAVYKQNAGFDKQKTGEIRRGDIVGTIRAVYSSGKGRPRILVPAPSELWRPGLWLALLFAGAGGVFAWQVTRNRGL